MQLQRLHRSLPVPPLTLEIADGDIAAQPTDAVVNAANNEFWMGAGVAGALKARGGGRSRPRRWRRDRSSPASASSRRGGRLPARYVIHAAVMGQDLQTSAALIERATRSALALAEARG